KEYFTERILQEGQELIRKWKSEDVYPYKDDAQTPIEVAERQMFDIVAVKLHESLPSHEAADKKGKAFHLRMLRQVIESSPEDLQNIIAEVLNLPSKSREQLSELLKDISLTGIINASKLVSDRLKFITGLEYLLFDEAGKKSLKERSQLHRMIAENTWIFGPEFTVSVDDQSLTEVLRKHRIKLGLDIIIDEPVKRIDGTVGIVDLMLSRSIPCNREDEIEHLVIELKAPKVKIGESECSQIKSYAFAVINDPRFTSLNARWNFLIISNEMDEYAKMETNQENRKQGVIFRKSGSPDLTVWAKTWSQVIKENKYRLEFVRDKLNCDVDKKDGIQYLRKVYSQFLKGVVIDGECLISSDETANLIK
ncbi:type I restriction enzyme HsdR N-terminal domain-containing protein, partial [Candidatus Roizmanbacteria bacterium]|nr:type I restriction enzyme HsdR N-terminal domain-containing protein [Candidatus Roizmanbacteria bacterium]